MPRKPVWVSSIVANHIGDPPNFLLKDSTFAQVEFLGVAKVLQSEKNAMEILDTMDI